jgi:plastocyanin
MIRSPNMSMICQHKPSVADRNVSVRKVAAAGIALFLITACAVKAPPRSARKGPERHDMTVHITVKDEGGRAVKDAVVYAVVKEHPAPTSRNAEVRGHSKTAKQHAVIILAKGAFHPVVLPLHVGSRITFRNRDSVQHHIYSISAAKKINILLNKGASSAPVRLNKAGIVVLGCAIDDQMIGYVYAMEYPHFSVTSTEGNAELAGLPPRAIDIRLWHPSMTNSSEEITKRVVPSSEGEVNVEFVIPLPNRAGRGSPPPASRAKER